MAKKEEKKYKCKECAYKDAYLGEYCPFAHLNYCDGKKMFKPENKK